MVSPSKCRPVTMVLNLMVVEKLFGHGYPTIQVFPEKNVEAQSLGADLAKQATKMMGNGGRNMVWGPRCGQKDLQRMIEVI